MEFGLLGRLTVTADGVDLTPTRPKQRALTALHGHISMLRGKLGAERIETRQSGYLLRLSDPDELDISLSLTEMNEETLTTARRQLDEAAFAEAWRRGQALTIGEAVELALDALA